VVVSRGLPVDSRTRAAADAIVESPRRLLSFFLLPARAIQPMTEAERRRRIVAFQAREIEMAQRIDPWG
jgi:hypothetical protein